MEWMFFFLNYTKCPQVSSVKKKKESCFPPAYINKVYKIKNIQTTNTQGKVDI